MRPSELPSLIGILWIWLCIVFQAIHEQSAILEAVWEREKEGGYTSAKLPLIWIPYGIVRLVVQITWEMSCVCITWVTILLSTLAVKCAALFWLSSQLLNWWMFSTHQYWVTYVVHQTLLNWGNAMVKSVLLNNFWSFHSLFFPLLYPLILSKSYFFSSFILALRWYFRLRW